MDAAPVLPAAPAQLAATEIQFDLLHLFLQAHIVVQIVLIGLALASFITWAIVIDRWRAISWEWRSATGFERLFWSGKSLEQIERALTSRKRPAAMGALFLAALKEWRLSIE